MISLFEIVNAVKRDAYLAGASFIVIWLMVLLFTRSFSLSFCGIMGSLMAYFPSLTLYRIFFGPRLSLLNIVSVWIILGVGADDIFIFLAAWKRSPKLDHEGEIVPLSHRLSFVYREAGVAMFATSFTTGTTLFNTMLSTVMK